MTANSNLVSMNFIGTYTSGSSGQMLQWTGGAGPYIAFSAEL
jgi:hypothetical protein